MISPGTSADLNKCHEVPHLPFRELHHHLSEKYIQTYKDHKVHVITVILEET